MERIIIQLVNLGFKIENHTAQSVLGVWFNSDIVLTVSVEVASNGCFTLQNCKVEGLITIVEKLSPNTEISCCELILTFCKDLIGSRISDTATVPAPNTDR